MYVGEERERLEALVKSLREDGTDWKNHPVSSIRDEELGTMMIQAADVIEHLISENKRHVDEKLMMIFGQCPQCKQTEPYIGVCLYCGLNKEKVTT